ncbi:serine/threonine-protein kinase [Thermogemmatispora carboxidivorans]|uniref:serine/threonine-protein kinase n=1 Tax=Thermogemmatispora carboxidivorans TaxID=1382306 RepID=UPI00069A2E6D|nr:serine/threonine-protein kinase [Thermogemmatispora carboxidivorans]
MLALEGRQLGNYDVIRRIRVGGMGAVYEGRQRTAFGRRVAIKVILGNYASDPDMRRRFAREARTIARLQHPHILPLIEFGEEQGLLYLVMPFIDGGTLTSYLRRIYRPQVTGREPLPFNLHELIDMYLQLLDAVEYAHDEGLVHRDIKSSNVLLELPRSGVPHVYLADFGLVRPARQAEHQIGRPIPLDQVPGTPQYMAPEQTRGIVTPLTDIYALGVLLFQMLTGELPYDDPDDIKVIQMQLRAPIPRPSRRNPQIPPAFDRVVRKAMAKRDDERFQNIAALREAVLLALEEEQQEQQELQPDWPEAPIEQPREPREAHPSRELPPLDYVYSGPNEPQIEELPPDEDIAAATTLPDVTAEALSRPRPQPDYRSRQELRTIALPMPEPLTIPRRGRPPAQAHPAIQRITEEPQPPLRGRSSRQQTSGSSRRPLSLFVAIALIVIAILLLLLFAARSLNIGLFPPGVPLLGADPTVVVTIKARSQTLQDTYLLTAAPQVQTVDLGTRTIPARRLSASRSLTQTLATSGTRTTQGSNAQGRLLFSNHGLQPVTVPAGSIFTGTSGISVRLLTTVVVPPRQGDQDGTASATAQAINAGPQGNIPAGDIAQPCCGRPTQLQVTNPAAFSGGSNSQTIHIVAQADLDRARQTLLPQLEHQLEEQLQAALKSGEALAGTPTYQVTLTANPPLGSQADQVRIQLQVTASATAYNPTQARQLASALLSRQAQRALGSAYQLRPRSLSASTPTVTAHGNRGIVYLSVTVHGLWSYQISPQTIARWQQDLRGTSSDVAQTYLRSQPGVASVDIRLPFGSHNLPQQADQIQIVINDQ